MDRPTPQEAKQKRSPFTKAVINSNREMYMLLIGKLLKFRNGLNDVIAGSDVPHENDVEDVEDLDKLLDWVTNGKIKDFNPLKP